MPITLENEMAANLVEVKIISLVSTSRYGSLSPGDKLITDAAYAKHLVEECAAAKYVNESETKVKRTAEKLPATLTQKAMNLLRVGTGKK
jgi:hypothetical protein